MQDVSDIGLTDDAIQTDARAEQELDEVQQWWNAVIETQWVSERHTALILADVDCM